MWNNSVTSHDGGVEISLSGFQLARKSVVFRVFPAVFARLLVIKQRRGTCRFVHKMTNNGFEMIARFIFWCTCQFCLLFRQWIIFTYEYLSWKIFPGLKIILWTLSRYFSCFMWKVETSREISLRNNRLWQNDRLLSSWASKMKTTSYILDDIKRFFPALSIRNKHFTTTANRSGRSIWVSCYCRYWPFVCYSWGYFTHLQWKKQAEGVGRAVDPRHDFYLMLKHHLFNSFHSRG